MNNKINLLKGHGDKTRFVREKTLRITRIVAVVAIVFVGLLTGFLFYILSASPLTALQQQEATLLSNLSQLHTKRTKLILAQARTEDIADIVSHRYRPDKVLAKIVTLVPQSVLIGSLSLNQKDLAITLSSPSLSTMDTFLSGIVEFSESADFSGTVLLDGFTIDPKASQYTFSLHMQFQ